MMATTDGRCTLDAQGEPRQCGDPDAARDQAQDRAEALELPRHRGRAAEPGKQPVDRLRDGSPAGSAIHGSSRSQCRSTGAEQSAAG